MKNTFKQSIYVFIIVIYLPLYSCTTNNKLIRFETGDSYLIITSTHIEKVLLEKDAVDKKYARVLFTNQGQKLISKFTGDNLNKKLSIIVDSKTLLKNITIREKLSTKFIDFSFDSDQKAEEFVFSFQGKI